MPPKAGKKSSEATPTKKEEPVKAAASPAASPAPAVAESSKKEEKKKASASAATAPASPAPAAAETPKKDEKKKADAKADAAAAAPSPAPASEKKKDETPSSGKSKSASASPAPAEESGKKKKKSSSTTSSELPVVVVFGATGAQGQSVAKALLATKKFTVRAVSRKASSDASKKLVELGCQVVEGDVSAADARKTMVESVFKGAWGAFVVLNFWEPTNFGKEDVQGKMVADAAAEAGVQVFLYSSLPHCAKESGGKWKHVAHFDQKAEVQSHVEGLHKAGKFKHVAFPLVAFYYQNFSSFFPPKPDEKTGKLGITMPKTDKLIAIDVSEIGSVIVDAFLEPKAHDGKDICLGGDELTPKQYVDIISKHMGEEITLTEVPVEVFVKFGFPGAEDLGEMFGWFNDFGFFNKREWATNRKKLTPFAKWAESNVKPREKSAVAPKGEATDATPASKKIVFITGANRTNGIGFETGRQLGLQHHFRVILGGRKGAADAANALIKLGIDATDVVVDVTNEKSVANAASSIEAKFGHIDVLINNAGSADWAHDGVTSKVPLQTMRETFDINFFGTVAVTNAFLPLLRKSAAPRIVNVSSILGSIGEHADPNSPIYGKKYTAYDCSKAAVNMYTQHLAHELASANFKCNIAHPGWVQTDMGGPSAPLGLEDGAKTSVKLATVPADGPNGGFFHMGSILRW